MKRGNKVAVCHDGKWVRRVVGEVIATRRGHHIKVRFLHPENGSPVEFWARKLPKEYSCFGGWADIDWFYPWYSVRKLPVNERYTSETNV
jgi:hypothetical protein